MTVKACLVNTLSHFLKFQLILFLFHILSASAVNLEGPNLVLHPRAKHSLDISQKIFLLAGDALFIPEGW